MISREAFEFALRKVQGLETELRAYELAVAAIKKAQPSLAQLLDATLNGARQSSPLLERMRLKYDEILGMFDRLVNESLSPEEAQKLLQEMKSKWIN